MSYARQNPHQIVIKRLAATAAATAVAASLLVGIPATSAHAAPIICEHGKLKVKWVVTNRSQVLTQKVMGYEKGYSGGSRTITKTLGHDKTIASGREFRGSATAGFTVKKVLSSLDVTLEGSYTHQKSKTTTKSVSVTDTLTKKGQYFFYRGTVQATGTWRDTAASATPSGSNRPGAKPGRSAPRSTVPSAAVTRSTAEPRPPRSAEVLLT
jgi:hypothetical protein